MAVKVLMKRTPVGSNCFMEINKILKELRVLAMSQAGYISGETLLAADQQGTTLVTSVWASVRHWRAYENSPERKAVLEKLEPLLGESTRTEIWVESPVVG